MLDNITSVAPARICLYGDHQDYLNLPVIAIAIDRYIKVEAKSTLAEAFYINKLDINKKDIIDYNKDYTFKDKPDFLRIALKVLKKFGCVPNKGYDVTISGNIPINSGLSSSSALTVAWIQFLLKSFLPDKKIDYKTLAELAYETEVIETKSSGGKMDQFTISHGDTIFLNTLNNQVHSYNYDFSDIDLVVGVSNAGKDTRGVLKKLKSNQLLALETIKNLFSEFDVYNNDTYDYNSCYESLDNDLKPYFKAAIKNFDITKLADDELRKNTPDIKTLGKLMTNHHNLLRDELKITTDEIDQMIDTCNTMGAYGSKIVGSGGGGSIVAIFDKNISEVVVSKLKENGAKDAFIASQSNGPNIKTYG
tara:strand:+ start:935 stop:2026 length:1092 start_codon:yes stop_codon:yes gene_type:complete